MNNEQIKIKCWNDIDRVDIDRALALKDKLFKEKIEKLKEIIRNKKSREGHVNDNSSILSSIEKIIDESMGGE